jgi:ankyrin repeat protein
MENDFFVAVQQGDINKVHSLINRVGIDTRSTAVHTAILFGKYDILKLLIENGADINAKDNQGNSPIHGAIENNEIHILRLLIEKGADINAKNNLGQSPLHLAVELDNFNCAQVLILSRVDINAQNNLGQSPLHLAVELENFNYVQVLILNRANINALDANRNSPIHIAIKNGNIEIMEYLIISRADLTIRNADGLTPFEIALQNENIEIMRYIINNTTDPEERSRRRQILNQYNIRRRQILNQGRIRQQQAQQASELRSITEQRNRRAGNQDVDLLSRDPFFSPSENFNESGQLNPDQLRVVDLPDNIKVTSFAWPGRCQICGEPEPINLCLVNCEVGHIFHCECINQWRNTKIAQGWQDRCPVCRNKDISTIAYVTPEIALPNSFGKKKNFKQKSNLKKLDADIAYLIS